jgi:hypothetical protein
VRTLSDGPHVKQNSPSARYLELGWGAFVRCPSKDMIS